MRRQLPPRAARGFSLVELLLVVAIIGVVAALAIPNLVHSRQAACSASAVSSLRLIHSSETSYRASRGLYGDLTALSNANFINDPTLRLGVKSRYAFDVTPDAADAHNAYVALATPAAPYTGVWRHYYIDASGVIRWRTGSPAVVTDPVINN